MRDSTLLAGLALIVASVAPLAATDGDFDATFGFGSGYVTWNGGGSVEVADGVALADGTLIGVGTYDAPSAAPVLHWQAFSKTGIQLIAFCGARKISPPKPDFKMPTRQQVEAFLAEVRLLTFREMQTLFPDCQILRERLFGLTKSYIAVRH